MSALTSTAILQAGEMRANRMQFLIDPPADRLSRWFAAIGDHPEAVPTDLRIAWAYVGEKPALRREYEKYGRQLELRADLHRQASRLEEMAA